MASDSDIEAYLNQLNRKTQSLSRDKDEASQSDSENVLVDKSSAAKDHINHHTGNSKIESLSDIRALSEKYRSRQPRGRTSQVSSEATDREGKDATKKKTQNEKESEEGEKNFYGRTIAHNEKAMQWLKKPVSLPQYADELRNGSGREQDATEGYEDGYDRSVSASLDEELPQNIKETHPTSFDKHSLEEYSDSDEEIIKLANVMTLDDILGTVDEDSGTPRAKKDITSQLFSVEVDGSGENEKCKKSKDDRSRPEVEDNLHSRPQNTEDPRVSTYEKSLKGAKNILLSGDGTVDSPFYRKSKNDHKTRTNTQFMKSPVIFVAKNRQRYSSKSKDDMKNLTFKSGISCEGSSMPSDEADVVESIAESVTSIMDNGDQHGKSGQMNEEDTIATSIQTVKSSGVPQHLTSMETHETSSRGEKSNEMVNDIGKSKLCRQSKSTKPEKNVTTRTRKGKKQQPLHLRKKLKGSSSKDSSESETSSSSETSESESSHVCRRKRRRRGRHDRLYKKNREVAPLSRYIFNPILNEGLHIVFPPSMVALEEVLKQQVGLTRQFINCHQAMYQEYTTALSSSHRYTTMKQIEKYIKKKKKKPLSFEEAFDMVKKEISTKERHDLRHST